MNTNRTAFTDFAKGYTNGQAAIALLAATMTPEQMKVIAIQNIIPIHVRNASDEAHGSSAAWADFQAGQRLAARRQRWVA